MYFTQTQTSGTTLPLIARLHSWKRTRRYYVALGFIFTGIIRSTIAITKVEYSTHFGTTTIPHKEIPIIHTIAIVTVQPIARVNRPLTDLCGCREHVRNVPVRICQLVRNVLVLIGQHVRNASVLVHVPDIPVRIEGKHSSDLELTQIVFILITEHILVTLYVITINTTRIPARAFMFHPVLFRNSWIGFLFQRAFFLRFFLWGSFLVFVVLVVVVVVMETRLFWQNADVISWF